MVALLRATQSILVSQILKEKLHYSHRKLTESTDLSPPSPLRSDMLPHPHPLLPPSAPPSPLPITLEIKIRHATDCTMKVGLSESIRIHHEFLCRIEKSHPRGRNFNLGRGLQSPWLKFLTQGWDFLVEIPTPRVRFPYSAKIGSWWILFLPPLNGLFLGPT